MLRKSYFYYAFVLLLTIAIISISSCEKDSLEPEPHDKIGHSLTGHVLSYNRLRNSTVISGALQELTINELKSNNGTSLGIQIDTTRIQMLESQFYKSYTFQIVQDSIEQEQFLKNYVLTVFNDSTITQFTMDYPVLAPGVYDITNAVARNYSGSQLYQIQNGCGWAELSSVEWNADGGECVETNCNSGNHTYGQRGCTLSGSNRASRTCTGAWVRRCSSGGGTGSGGGTDPEPGDPYADGFIVGTSPNDGTITQNVQKENCKTLNDLTKTDSLSLNIKPFIDSLRLKTGEDKEYSISFMKEQRFGEIYNKPDAEGIRAGTSRNESYATMGNLHYGQAHTHPAGTYAMFSWNDLRVLRDYYDEVNENFSQDIFLMIVNDDGTVYALKINDYGKLNTEINRDLNGVSGTERKKIDKLNEKIQNDFSDSDNLEVTFLDKFKDYGATLYESADQNLTNWNELQLNEAGDQIIERQCD
jgi:hypothetical protein